MRSGADALNFGCATLAIKKQTDSMHNEQTIPSGAGGPQGRDIVMALDVRVQDQRSPTHEVIATAGLPPAARSGLRGNVLTKDEEKAKATAGRRSSEMGAPTWATSVVTAFSGDR